MPALSALAGAKLLNQPKFAPGPPVLEPGLATHVLPELHPPLPEVFKQAVALVKMKHHAQHVLKTNNKNLPPFTLDIDVLEVLCERIKKNSNHS